MRKVTITEKGISIRGFGKQKFFEPGNTALQLGSCRDVGRVALVWAIQQLSEDLARDLNGDWDSQHSGIED